MSIKYKFMALGLRQMELAAEVKRRCAEDGTGYDCQCANVSGVLTKADRGIPFTKKEGVIYNHLLDILAEKESSRV